MNTESDEKPKFSEYSDLWIEVCEIERNKGIDKTCDLIYSDFKKAIVTSFDMYQRRYEPDA